jgi:hypothetical protein
LRAFVLLLHRPPARRSREAEAGARVSLEAVPEVIEDEKTVAERTAYCPERRRLVLMLCACAEPGDCDECAPHAPDCGCENCFEELEDLRASYLDDGGVGR